MYCPKCGIEVNDDAEVCVHCGCSLTKTKPEYKESKTGLGVVMALFFLPLLLLLHIIIKKIPANAGVFFEISRFARNDIE